MNSDVNYAMPGGSNMSSKQEEEIKYFEQCTSKIRQEVYINNYCYYIVNAQLQESNAFHAAIQGTKLILGEKALKPVIFEGDKNL